MTILTVSLPLLTGLLIATCYAQERPTVCSTIPATGDDSVDPDLTELRVEFDRPMATNGGYSFVGGGPQFPEVAGKPRWISERIVVLPVKLEPDHDYRLSINAERFQNFRGANGAPAIPYPISFRTRTSPAAPALTADDNRRAMAALRAALETRYSHFELRPVDWAARFTAFESRLLEAATPGHFAVRAADLLAAAQDAHLWLTVKERVFASFPRRVAANINPAQLGHIVPGFRQVNDTVATGRFPEGPAYVLIGSWERKAAQQVQAAATFIDSLARGTSLIIDVRPNSGGDESLAREIAARFIAAPVLYARHRFRDASQPTGFSPAQDRVLTPAPNRPAFGGKLAILMGPANMSSCEAFLLMMKQVPGCQLIGAASSGSSGNPQPIALGNGVTAMIPSWIALTPESEPIEGRGLRPTLEVAFSSAEPARDPVLDAALSILAP